MDGTGYRADTMTKTHHYTKDVETDSNRNIVNRQHLFQFSCFIENA